MPSLSGRSVKAKYLLWAPLVFSFLCILQLPTAGTGIESSLDSPAGFLISYLIGGLVTYAVSALAASVQRKAFPALFCILPAIIGVALAFLYHEAQFGALFQVPLGAGLVGVSSSLLFVSWGQAFSLLESKQLAPTVVACIIVALLLKLLFFPLAHTPFNLVIIGAAIIISAFPLDSILNKARIRQKEDSLLQAIPTKGLFFKLLRPVFGMVLCCMIWGFIWGNSLQGVAIATSGTVFAVLIDVGKLLTAIILFLLLRAKPIDPAQGLILSLATGFLLIAWMLMGPKGFGPIVSTLISGAGFILFDVALWVRLGELGRRSPYKARRLVSIVRAVLMAVILLGIGMAPIIGAKGAELFTPIFSVLFFILMTATATRKMSPIQVNNHSPLSDDGPPARGSEPQLVSFRVDYGLSDREAEVFSYFVRGHSANFISNHLMISTHTVKTHIKHIYKKVGVHSKDGLITFFNDHYL